MSARGLMKCSFQYIPRRVLFERLCEDNTGCFASETFAQHDSLFLGSHCHPERRLCEVKDLVFHR